MKPILFSTPMIRAILDDRKSQTRRAMNPQPVKNGMFWQYSKTQSGTIDPTEMDSMPLDIRCKYGQAGDVLWVRETWANDPHENVTYLYKQQEGENAKYYKWKPSIFMPREACRLFLEITDIKVERLQDISEDDAKAEGVVPFVAKFESDIDCWTDGKYKTAYQYLWNEINGWMPNSWDSNPFVWKISFKRLTPNPSKTV